MLNIILLLLILGGLWLYGRCCLGVHIRDCDLYIDEVELRYVDDAAAARPAASGPVS